ncbi:MAG: hypothetical protein RBU21_00615 [FCB group bacterium]|nr:hypothetical protein [FCB group bacterium]
MSARKKSFAFDNYGGSYHLRIGSAEDLKALDLLDEPFWVATSAPADRLRSDDALVKRLDRDGDGRILSADIRAAVNWMFSVLADRQGVDRRSDVLHLDTLDTSNDEGRELRAAAEHILDNLGHGDAGALTLEAVRNRAAIVARGEQNGDGVIPLSGIADDALRAFAADIMETTGSVQDLNGEPGVDETLLDRFLADTGALLDWREKLGAAESPGMFPLGEATAGGYALLDALREPFERYFELCKVVGLNRMLGRETLQPESPPEVYQDRAKMEEYLEEAPIARPRPEPVLPYEEDVNPAYADRVRAFRDTVAQGLLGDGYSPSRLTEDEWSRIKTAFLTYEKWLHSKSGGAVEKLGPEKLNAYLACDLPARLRKMIETDRAAGAQLAATHKLEYLILLQRWILELCNNFVSFPYLYDPDHRASFEEGRMIMDGKIHNLNTREDDIETHSARAERSGISLLYSEVTRGEPQEKFFLVTPVARVDLGNLGVDKRGVLFDLEGREWDVRVVKVVENVVSLKQALLQPFKRIGQFFQDAFGKLSGTAEQQLLAQGTQAAPGAPAPPARPPTSVRDMLLAGGVGVAALGSSFAYIGKTLSNPDAVLRTFGVILAIIVLLLIPVAIYAFIKMHARNLSGLLEASGWAINARMRLTRAVARIICIQPKRPEDRFSVSHRDFARLFSRRHTEITSHKPQNEE